MYPFSGLISVLWLLVIGGAVYFLAKTNNRISRLEKKYSMLLEHLAKEKESLAYTSQETEQTTTQPVAAPLYKQVQSETIPDPLKDLPIKKKNLGEDISEKFHNFGGPEVSAGQWLTRIGIVAIIFAAAFFLKFAFDNDWIGETGRVALGIIGGLALIGLGYYFSKKYAVYSQILTGGGIAILYLSIYGALDFYHLISNTAAFIGMILITLFGGALCLFYNSPTIAVMSIVGGFLTPYLVSTGNNNLAVLFPYLIILSGGILCLSVMKNWRVLNILGLAGTWIIFFGWYGRHFSEDQFGVALVFASILFLIYAFSTIIYIVLRSNIGRQDIALIAINAAAYFGIVYYMFNVLEYDNFLGFYSVIMAAFYILLAYASYTLNNERKDLFMSLSAVAAFFLVIASPLQFDGHWVTISWAAEGVILLWLAFQVGLAEMRFASLAIIMIAIGHLFIYDTVLKYNELAAYTVIFNKRFFTYMFCVISLYAMAYLFRINQEKIPEGTRSLQSIFMGLANILTLSLFTMEILSYYDSQITTLSKNAGQLNTQSGYSTYNKNAASKISETMASYRNRANFGISLLWTIYSLALMGFGLFLRLKILRIFAIVLAGLAIAKVFIWDMSILSGFSRILSFFVLGVILLLIGFLYQKYRKEIAEFLIKD